MGKLGYDIAAVPFLPVIPCVSLELSIGNYKGELKPGVWG